MAFKMYFHIGTGKHRGRQDHVGGSEFETVCGTWVRDCNIASNSLLTKANVDCPQCAKLAEDAHEVKN